MKVAAIQLDIAWEHRDLNYQRVERFTYEAKNAGAQLIVLPEMFATGFSLSTRITAEDRDGKTMNFLCSLARKHKIGVIGGLVLQGEDGFGENTAVVINEQGELVSSYIKTHLFSYMGEELAHFPGDGPKVFEICGLKCACFICYDLRFPELFRLVADETACVFVIASWPATRQRHWDVLLPARAVENQLYLVGVNRVGHGDGLNFTGGSAIYGPNGECLSSGGRDEQLLLADIESSEVNRIREEMPFLADRRYTQIAVD